MNINKNTLVRFIYKGKQVRFRIMFTEMFNTIPLYYSSDIQNTITIKLEDNSIFIVTNKQYRERIGKIQFELEVWHQLVELVYNKRIADIYCAYWFDFKSVISLIRGLKNIDKTEKNKRITLLEKLLVDTDNDVKVETQESLISKLDIDSGKEWEHEKTCEWQSNKYR